MSSILEALKKLEDEKSARLSGSGNIAGKVVKSGRWSKQRPAWLLPAAMAATAAAASMATYLLMDVPAGNGPAPAPAVTTPQEPRPVSAPPAGAGLRPGSPSVAAPAPPRHESPSPAAEKTPAVVTTRAERAEPVIVEKPAPPPQAAAVQEPPSLKISGIGWQKGSADRLAIVTGWAAAEGAVIEGARVEEIFPDRVRFSFNGRQFEVPLGKIAGERP